MSYSLYGVIPSPVDDSVWGVAESYPGYLVRLQRESQRALFDLAWPQYMWIASAIGIPALVLGAEDDAFFTRAMIEETAWMHRAAPTIFPDMAHVMMLEPGWRDVAERIVAWLDNAVPGTTA